MDKMYWINKLLPIASEDDCMDIESSPSEVRAVVAKGIADLLSFGIVIPEDWKAEVLENNIYMAPASFWELALLLHPTPQTCLKAAIPSLDYEVSTEEENGPGYFPNGTRYPRVIHNINHLLEQAKCFCE